MTRHRRVQAAPPQEMYAEEDRIYTEEDYAVSAEPIADEWADEQELYPSAGWTGENFMPDEAFEPDEEEVLPEPSWTENFPGADEDAPSRFGSFEDTDDIDPLSDDLLTEEEQAELKRSHWQLISGLADFAGVIAGTAAILVLMTLLMSLINWLVNDMSQSFILLQKHF